MSRRPLRLVTGVPVALAQATAAAVQRDLARSRPQHGEMIYVVDEARRFVGAFPVARLLAADPDARAGELADRAYPRARPGADQETSAASALAASGAISVALVDARDRFAGAVPARELLAILREEHVEDLHRLSGIQREARFDHEALEAPPVRRARHRLPWLVVGLAGSFVAAAVMASFERVLANQIAVAFFVPAIVYLADAIGTQTEAIAVRGLSLGKLSLRHLIGGELRTGLLIGGALGALAFPVIALAFGDPRLGVAVAIAIVVAGSFASTIGLLLPWLLHRSGTDPAFGSGPLATILQDIASLVIYFAVASAIL
jgi:magnesium transporter